MRKVLAVLAALMVALLPLAGTVSASGGGITSATIAWYYLYLHQQDKFNELYNLSVQMNVSNETLQEVWSLYENATAEYSNATAFGLAPGKSAGVRWLSAMVHIRKAYLYMSQAVELLEEALAPFENQTA
ncbi:pyrolysin [Thermococcus sp. 21S7]|uniref:pyrolysin n=1 Tax=Thermococcus sp. 21S7 TaxID=1638221 RepID=UPI00143B3DBF|nr:pyrolysin [Thermococcus sp. 21S7]NJE61039.1 pyrolysin [Thermococcus sp. 21S7]